MALSKLDRCMTGQFIIRCMYYSSNEWMRWLVITSMIPKPLQLDE